MFGRGALLFAIGLLLSGCVTGTGVDYAGLSRKIGPPKPGQSRIVVLQEKTSAMGFASCACDMKLDESAIGQLRLGTYVYADRPAGRHQLSGTESLYPGETKREITTESGRTYFFVVRTSQRHDALVGAAVLTGLAGLAVTAVATSGSDNPGPVDIFPLDESAARVTLAELQLAQ